MAAIAEAPLTSASGHLSAPNTPEALTYKAQLAAVDRSLRGPILLFFGSAVGWLLVGSLLGVIADFKMSLPALLSDWSYLTYGRVRPAQINALTYGWGVQVGMAVGLWLLARLCRREVHRPELLLAAAGIYNMGITLGVVSILSGRGTSVEWLDFPPYAATVVFLGLLLVSLAALVIFRFRDKGHVYVSQWYVMAAFLWLPWMYATAYLFIFFLPVQAGAQGPVNWWYGHNLLALFFSPLGLASAYYLIPKVIGRPVHSYYLSILGFWSLSFFAAWGGMRHLNGGPFPAWMVSAGIVASIMMLVPVAVTAINLHVTMRGHFEALRWSPTLRFTVFGAVAFTLFAGLGAITALRTVDQVTHFTHFNFGFWQLGFYAFYAMSMFGAIYYIVPRLVEWEWPSANLIRWQFWLSTSGIVTTVGVLCMAGFIQGLALDDPKIPFLASTNYVAAFLWVRGVASLVLLAAHIALAASFVLIFLRAGAAQHRPTLLDEPVA